MDGQLVDGVCAALHLPTHPPTLHPPSNPPSRPTHYCQRDSFPFPKARLSQGQSNNSNIWAARWLAVATGDKLVAKGTLDAEKLHGGDSVQIKNGTPLDVMSVNDHEVIVRDREGTELAIGRHAQRIDHAYAQTVHQAQGQDYKRAIGHAESTRENLASLKQLYVALSRAREKFTVVTDNRDALAATLERNTGQKATALGRPNEQTVTAPYELGKLAEYREPQGLAPTPPEPSTAPVPDPAPVAPEPLPEIGGSPAPTPDPVPAAPEPQPEVADSPAAAPDPGHEPSHDDGPSLG